MWRCRTRRPAPFRDTRPAACRHRSGAVPSAAPSDGPAVGAACGAVSVSPAARHGGGRGPGAWPYPMLPWLALRRLGAVRRGRYADRWCAGKSGRHVGPASRGSRCAGSKDSPPPALLPHGRFQRAHGRVCADHRWRWRWPRCCWTALWSHRADPPCPARNNPRVPPCSACAWPWWRWCCFPADHPGPDHPRGHAAGAAAGGTRRPADQPAVVRRGGRPRRLHRSRTPSRPVLPAGQEGRQPRRQPMIPALHTFARPPSRPPHGAC
jgi:hypothetical protein